MLIFRLLPVGSLGSFLLKIESLWGKSIQCWTFSCIGGNKMMGKYVAIFQLPSVEGVRNPVICFPDEKCSQSATPASSKAASPVPVVFEYNNRSGTPTRLNEDLLKRRKTSRSKSPSESRKKRRKKSPTPPSAYANPHRQVSVLYITAVLVKINSCLLLFFWFEMIRSALQITSLRKQTW